MYPVVICHGFIGYRNMLFWAMFHQVDTVLHENGIQAYRCLVHPTASIEVRAQQIKEQIEARFGTTQPLHILAHSMGGLDARYLASPHGMNLGDRICTITTLSTPHHGAYLASRIPQWFTSMVSFGAWILHFTLLPGESRSFFSKLAQNRWNALRQLNPEFLRHAFNPVICDHPNVRYFSYGSVVNPFSRNLSGMIRKKIAKRIERFDGLNDGMVGIQSAAWGTCKGTMLANHGEIVGLKIIPWSRLCFDYISFILEEVKTLPRYETPPETRNL